MPRDELQKAFTKDTYLQSVWQAPAKKSFQLRRQISNALGTVAADGSVQPEASDAASAHMAVATAAMVAATFTSKLPPADFEPLMERSRLCTLAEREPAFTQGSAPSAFYLVRDGRCQVEYTSKAGDTAVVAELGPGDHFGEGALLDRRDRRNSTVRCIAPSGCRVGVLGKMAFEAYLREHPELSNTLEAVTSARNTVRLRSVIQLAADRSECERVAYAPGQTVFSQGEKAESFFLVDSGTVQMGFVTADGRLLPVRQYPAGSMFGASGLLAATGDNVRRCTATAIEPTVLRAVPHARFQVNLPALPPRAPPDGHSRARAGGSRRATPPLPFAGADEARHVPRGGHAARLHECAADEGRRRRLDGGGSAHRAAHRRHREYVYELVMCFLHGHTYTVQ